MNPTKEQIKFLRKKFWQANGVQTCDGTKAMWKSLEKSELVSVMPMGGFLGHPFFYNITEKGQQLVVGGYNANWFETSEAIYQYRCVGGEFGIGAVAGACGPSSKELGKFWASSSGVDLGIHKTLQAAKYAVLCAVAETYGSPNKSS